jgi:subtilisin
MNVRRPILAVLLAMAMVVGLMNVASASPGAATRSSFIVVLQPGTADVPGVAADLAASVLGEVGFVYEHAIEGFSITASDAAALALARNPRVVYVERDQEVTLAAQEVPTGIDRISANGNIDIDIDGSDDWRVDVDVAVIDTGVDFEHPDLNVVGGVNCASGGPFGGACQPGGDDDHYHGTHVAGTIGAFDNGIGVVGVAPGARIHAVKVLNKRGSGYTSWIVAGIDWVAGYNHPENGGIEVANMSLGGSGYSQAEYDAIVGAVENGVAFAVAAGNSNDDANNYSPATFDNVLTVSALADFDGKAGGLGSPTCRTDVDDTLADFSNWGSDIDIAAPGVCILSTYPIEKGSYNTISGTSMASPHAAGALALLASTNNPDNTADVTRLYDSVKLAGNLDWDNRDDPDNTKERLLDVGSFVPTLIAGGGTIDPGPSNNDPTITITSPTDGATFDTDSSVPLMATAGDIDADDTVTVTWEANGVEPSLDVDGRWFPADDTYVIMATASDGQGGTATDTVTITVGDPPTSTLAGSAVNNGRTWTATVTYTGDSGTGVSGSWSLEPDNGVTCSTGDGFSCSISRDIPKKTGSVTFTPESGAAVTILKP